MIDEFQYTLDNLGRDYNGFNLVYQPGNKLTLRSHALRILTDVGITGEYIGGGGPSVAQVAMVANYLLGKNPLEREKIYNDIKRGLRHYDATGLGLIDIALWDFAGKLYGVPLYQLLGGWRKSIPAYASTYHGDFNGGLSSPEAFADFAEQCYELGYRAFKIHGWGNAPIEMEVANVHAVGKRVGGKMDLMLDPACEYNTFADALKVGRACDEENFFWLEDPYKDGGVSTYSHKKLRELIKTPILQTEHIRLLEQHANFALAEATDFLRVGAHEDGGITGAMKIAHLAEALGIDVEFHGGSPAHRHCIAAVRNTNYYELGLVNPKVKVTKPPVYKNYSDEREAIDKNGHVPVPEGPGLGVEIDWDWIKKHRTGGVEYK